MNVRQSPDIIRTDKINRAMKIFFFLCFASLVIYGMLPYTENQEYAAAPLTEPVFSYTVEAGNDNFSRDALATPGVSASGAALLCADTGELIFGKNSNKVLPMASTTKIMTALIVLENANPEDIITVSKEACALEGSSIYLKEGEKITVRDLLYGLMLESGNDAASALAIGISGSEAEFVNLMNQKAKALGLISTHFENPHGLSAEGHCTTAYELALITYHAMKEPAFREIVSTKNYTACDEAGNPTHYYSNHNKMLRSYSGACGVKTGYTIASGRCLVSSAEREGSTYIAVTLNDRNDWHDHAEMLDFAFENYTSRTFFEKGALHFTLDGKTYENRENVALVTSKSAKKLEFTVVLE